MSVADNLKEAFSGTRGKVLILLGAGVIGYIYWTRGRTTGGGAPVDELIPDTSPSGRNPQTDPAVGNDTQSDGATKRPTTNAEWVTQGVDILVGRGTPGSTAQNALTNAMSGLPITQQESALVSQVISILGSPPEGMPPLNIQAPTATPTEPRGYGWYKAVSGDSIEKIAKKHGVGVADLWVWNGRNINKIYPGEYVRVRENSNPRNHPYTGV